MRERIEQRRRQSEDKAELSRLLPGAGIERLSNDEVAALLAYLDRIMTEIHAQSWRAGAPPVAPVMVDCSSPTRIISARLTLRSAMYWPRSIEASSGR